MRARLIPVLVAAFFGGGLLLAAPASAHSVLISSSPTDGASLSVPPTKVVFSFNENVRNPAYVVVTAPDGTRKDTGAARVLDNTVTEDVKPLTEAGRYTFAYRVVSADGHVVTRQLSFTMTTGTPVSAPSSAPIGGGKTGGGARLVELAAVGVLLLIAIAFLLRGRRTARRR